MPVNMDENPLGLILSRTYLAYKKTTTRNLSEQDITPEQFAVLNELSKAGSHISQKKLAELTVRDQTTVGKIIDKLIRKGLVTREEDPQDRRAVLLCLTAEGLEMNNVLTPKAKQQEQEALAECSPEELEAFMNVMNRIYEKLK